MSKVYTQTFLTNKQLSTLKKVGRLLSEKKHPLDSSFSEKIVGRFLKNAGLSQYDPKEVLYSGFDVLLPQHRDVLAKKIKFSLIHKKHKQTIDNCLRRLEELSYILNEEIKVCWPSGKGAYDEKWFDYCLEKLGKIKNEIEEINKSKDNVLEKICSICILEMMVNDPKDKYRPVFNAIVFEIGRLLNTRKKSFV